MTELPPTKAVSVTEPELKAYVTGAAPAAPEAIDEATTAAADRILEREIIRLDPQHHGSSGRA
jgi:hypothetical protein